jgi:hypothetical protein
MALASHDDEPAGAFMMTFTSLPELRGAFPGREFHFLEKPRPPEKVVQPLSADLQRKVSDLMQKAGVSSPTPSTHQRTVVHSVETDEELPKAGRSQSSKELSLEILKRLKTAREYASKKNQRELDIKIEAISQLIEEVFGA